MEWTCWDNLIQGPCSSFQLEQVAKGCVHLGSEYLLGMATPHLWANYFNVWPLSQQKKKKKNLMSRWNFMRFNLCWFLLSCHGHYWKEFGCCFFSSSIRYLHTLIKSLWAFLPPGWRTPVLSASLHMTGAPIS